MASAAVRPGAATRRAMSAARGPWSWVLPVPVAVGGAIAGTWQLATAAVLASIFLAVLRAGGPAQAGLVVTSVALPIYGVAWLASASAGLGLFTLVLAVLVVALAPAALRDRVAVGDALGAAARAPAAWALLAFAGWAVLSLALAPRGPSSMQIAREYVGQVVALPVLFVVAFALVRDRGPSGLGWRATTAVVAVGVVGSVLAIAQIAFDAAYLAPGGELDAFVGERATGLSEHPGTWSAFAVLPLAFAGAAWLRLGGRWWAIATVLLSAGVILASARAAWIAMVIVAALALLAPGAPALRRLGTVALLLGGLALSAVVWDGGQLVDAVRPGGSGAGHTADRDTPGRMPAERARGAARLQVDESASTRLILTRSELWLGAREPLTGLGLGNVGPALAEYDVPYVEGKSRDELGFSPGDQIDKHNTYAGLFAELGAVGALAFVAAIALALLALHRCRATLGRDPRSSALVDGLTAALVGTAALAVFTDADRQSFVWWLLAMGLALSVAAARGPRRA